MGIGGKWALKGNGHQKKWALKQMGIYEANGHSGANRHFGTDGHWGNTLAFGANGHWGEMATRKNEHQSKWALDSWGK